MLPLGVTIQHRSLKREFPKQRDNRGDAFFFTRFAGGGEHLDRALKQSGDRDGVPEREDRHSGDEKQRLQRGGTGRPAHQHKTKHSAAAGLGSHPLRLQQTTALLGTGRHHEGSVSKELHQNESPLRVPATAKSPIRAQ